MDPTPITFFEHQKLSYSELGWENNDSRLDQLELLNIKNQATVFHVGRHYAQATQFVGVVRFSWGTIQVLPKIDYNPEGDSEGHLGTIPRQKAIESATRNLLDMLAYTQDFNIRSKEIADLIKQRSDWFELLTRIYAMELYQQLKFGLEHAYVNYEDDLPVIRGKWQIARQVSHRPHILHRFDVSYDEFSPDTLLNRIFSYVTNMLLSVTRDSTNKKMLLNLHDWFSGIGDTAPNPIGLLPQIHFTRLNARFQPAFNLARLFLEGHAYQLSVGSHQVFAFIFDMNTLFEEFIGRFLIQHKRSILPERWHDSRITLQSKGSSIYLAEQIYPSSKHFFRLIPDISINSPSGYARIILDTKYKQLDPSKPYMGVAASDLYQMLAYSLRLNCPQTVLLYPQSASGQILADIQIQEHPQKIRIGTLNIRIPLNKPDVLSSEMHNVLAPLMA